MFFLICRVAHAGAGPRTGRHPTGSGDRRAWPGFAPASAPPPSVGGGKALLPSIEPVAVDSQLLGDHFSGLATGKPVVNGFTFERFIEFTANFDCCLVHGLVGSLFTQFSVRQFEATRSSVGGNGDWALHPPSPRPSPPRRGRNFGSRVNTHRSVN